MEKVSSRIKISDNMNIAKLSITEQISLLLSKLGQDDADELDAASKLTAQHLKEISAFTRYIDRETRKLSASNHRSVTLEVSSKFKKFFDEVFDEKKGRGLYYKFEILQDDNLSSVDYFILVRISKK